MNRGIDHLLEEGIITEVLGRLQSGKEAEVFIVQYGERVVAAKVYKDRGTRSFKNDSGYKEGRSVRNSRSQRAMERGSSFGKTASEDAWKSAEVEALYTLHRAGVRVPAPVMFIEGVLLMELVLAEDGSAARRLIDTRLEPAQANRAYHDMLQQLVRILSCDLIHGDLSPYNVLWAATGPTIIDFPQIISASHNTRAEMYFLRDARNILGHFVAADTTLRARHGDAEEIWRAYARRELGPDFVPQGRSRPLPPRARVDEPRPRPPARQDPPRPSGAPHRPPHSEQQRGGAVHPQRTQPTAAHPEQRRGAAAHPQRPQPNAGHPPRPQPNEGHPQRPQPNAGHPQRPQPNAGHPQRQPNAGHPQRPPSNAASPQRPQSNREGRPRNRPDSAPHRSRPAPEIIVRAHRGPPPPDARPRPAAPPPPPPRTANQPPRRQPPSEHSPPIESPRPAGEARPPVNDDRPLPPGTHRRRRSR